MIQTLNMLKSKLEDKYNDKVATFEYAWHWALFLILFKLRKKCHFKAGVNSIKALLKKKNKNVE